MSRPAWVQRLDALIDAHDCYDPRSPHPATTIVSLLCAVYGHDVVNNRCVWCYTTIIGVEGTGIFRLEHSAETITNVHPIEACDGRPCPIHNRSAHHMRRWPQHWRDDRLLMERLCPHGVGHPDPDHLAAVMTTRGPSSFATDAVHGCDGCCNPQNKENR